MDAFTIQDFLTRLDQSRRRLTGEELEVLYKLATHPDPLVRSDVAAFLNDHYEERSEDVLLDLTYDPVALVRADAVDSLRIGRKKKVLRRLVHLLQHDPDYTVRGFAALSVFDMFINMLGDSDGTLKMITELLTPLLQKEEHLWTRSCYYCVLCLCGQRAYLQELLDLLDNEDFYVRSSVLDAFAEILNEENEAEIEEALQYNLSFEMEQRLIDKMEELLLRIEEDREGQAF